jgi:hypothetical protein
MYDWGRRGIRSRNGFRFRGSNGRMRCFFDPTWNNEFETIMARSGQGALLRRIARITPEWIAVAKRRGAFWPVAFYLVPRYAARLAREQLAHEKEKSEHA